MNYLIEIVSKTGTVEAVGSQERDKTVSWTKPTPSGYQYCTKFKNKVRAERVANRVAIEYNTRHQSSCVAKVVPEFGGFVSGAKSTVAAPKADRVRRN